MRKLSDRLKGFFLCLLAIWAIGFSACQDEYSEPTGFLYLNVQEDATLLTKAAVVDESLQVAIIKADGDTLKVYQDYLREVKGERLILPVGTYTVAVSSNHDGKAHWETPFYAGSEEVIVEQGKIANSTVRCTIANTKVSVKYADSMGEYFSDYQTTVSNGSGELVYTRDEYRSGYFAPEKLTVQLDLVNRDGNKFALKRVYPDVQPQSHYTFAFKLNTEGEGDTDAGMDMDVSIDTEHNEITYPIYIKEEDLTNAVRPSFKLTGFDESDTYAYKEESDLPTEGTILLSYTMGKESRLQYVKVSTNSPQFIEQGLGSFDWMSETAATALGFPAFPTEATEVIDMKASYTVDLSGIVQHLKCTEGKPTTHSFTLELLDDKYQEASLSFAIKIKPNIPAFVESEPVAVWTNFAVIRGYCADEESYFMVKADEGEEIVVKNIARDSEGNMTALLTGLQPGVSYTYRIVSDNDPTMQCNPQSFTISSPLAVPNLGFEDWSTYKKSAVAFGMGGTFIAPNASGSSIYWDSGNWGSSAADATLTQSTDVTATGSGKAAYMKAMFAAKMGIGAFAAGSVFAGEAQTVSQEGATLKYGHEYNGYPTALRGYYKYAPKSINYFGDKTPNGVSKGDTDQCMIYIALGTQSLEVVSTTSTIKPFSKDREGVFAYGEFISSTTEDRTGETPVVEPQNGYQPFKIPLIYTSMPPKGSKVYLFVVATTSRYGDYFTGGEGSELYIDELSLDYDYNAASLAETSFGSLQPNNLSTSNE